MKTIIFDLDGTIIDLASGRVFLTARELEALSSRFQFALVTRSPWEQVVRVLEELQMKKFFPRERIICCEDTVGDKRTGEPFLKVKKVVGEDAVVIGDSEVDEIGAQRAGYLCIRVSSARSVEQAIPEAVARLL